MPELNWYDRVLVRPKVLKLGDNNPAVLSLQRLLRAVDPSLKPDGDFGPATERAVRKFQKAHDIVADGIVGPKTLSALEGLDVTKLLGQSDIERAAKTLGTGVAEVMAVQEVESNGSGFLPDGRPVILFERHWMRRLLIQVGINPDPWRAKYPNLVNPNRGGYQGYEAEHDRLKAAKFIHSGSAIQSCSWGLFQIMGFHYERLGFDSPEAMEAAANESEGAQLDMFVAFIQGDTELHQALIARDWDAFAEIYNGSAYAEHNYHGRMADAFDRHQHVNKVEGMTA
ncbi:N-acetylmuramidase domain-containing protein [Vreelandella alkaliphila]|uniref:N-acetylmuramidase domain-containing protein n=1 Tax=Vreelandella alkaliphila TaxID=272774 RepID=A0AAJ2VRC7_9GAMM|nr:N-acetylmuramidase domain-containing protein [Halomonas alkaliphila]MDX5979603.1 N-acetylmuramidase domain-containing protein [Halomonas alkaliphila]